MAGAVVFSPRANAQLIALYTYIGQASSAAVAEGFVSAIIDYCEGLAVFPGRGTPREDIRPGLKTSAFRRRVVIAYAVIDRTATILGVFYGGQDFEDILVE